MRETYRQYRDGQWSAEVRQICKASPVGPFYAMIAGLDRDNNGFKPLDEIQKAWQRPGESLDELASPAGDALRRRLMSLLETIRAIDPGEFDRRYRGELALQVALLGMEGRTPKVVVLEFATSSSSDAPTLSLRVTRCPGDCPHAVSAYFLGTHEKIDESARRDPRFVAGLDERNIAALIDLERQDRPDLVGGLVAVIRISVSGTMLLQSGTCSTNADSLK
jgi:hypothetical protein